MKTVVHKRLLKLDAEQVNPQTTRRMLWGERLMAVRLEFRRRIQDAPQGSLSKDEVQVPEFMPEIAGLERGSVRPFEVVTAGQRLEHAQV